MKCQNCHVNFCWICVEEGALEGHFNIPGKCFGRLFEDESDPDALNRAVFFFYLFYFY